MEKRTIIDQIEIARDGTVRVRFAKQIVDDDGETVLRSEWHRAVIEPGQNLDETMSLVSAHLVSMKEAPISEDESARVRRVVALEHSPDVIATFRIKQAENIAKQMREMVLDGRLRPKAEGSK